MLAISLSASLWTNWSSACSSLQIKSSSDPVCVCIGVAVGRLCSLKMVNYSPKVNRATHINTFTPAKWRRDRWARIEMERWEEGETCSPLYHPNLFTRATLYSVCVCVCVCECECVCVSEWVSDGITTSPSTLDKHILETVQRHRPTLCLGTSWILSAFFLYMKGTSVLHINEGRSKTLMHLHVLSHRTSLTRLILFLILFLSAFFPFFAHYSLAIGQHFNCYFDRFSMIITVYFYLSPLAEW